LEDLTDVLSSGECLVEPAVVGAENVLEEVGGVDIGQISQVAETLRGVWEKVIYLKAVHEGPGVVNERPLIGVCYCLL
jgi:hypothetical protein